MIGLPFLAMNEWEFFSMHASEIHRKRSTKEPKSCVFPRLSPDVNAGSKLTTKESTDRLRRRGNSRMKV